MTVTEPSSSVGHGTTAWLGDAAFSTVQATHRSSAGFHWSPSLNGQGTSDRQPTPEPRSRAITLCQPAPTGVPERAARRPD